MAAFTVAAPLSLIRPVRVPASCPLHGRPYSVSMSAARSLVWIRKGDRRTVDHEGLAAASNADVAAAIAVVDADTDLAVLAAFSRALKKRGATLSLCAAEDEVRAVADFARAFAATSVHVHLDETEESRTAVRELAQHVRDEICVETWQDALHDWDAADLSEIPYEYPEYRRWKSRIRPPLPSIATDDALRFLPTDSRFTPPDANNFLASVRESSVQTSDMYTDFLRRYSVDSMLSNTQSVDAGDLDADEYGERIVRRYLESADAGEEPDLARTLAPVFAEGLVSSRRMYELVVQYERENGRIFRPVYREGAKRLLNYLEAREFAQLLARRDLETAATVDGVHRARFWRWRGLLVRYVDEGSASDKPPLLLVHGFGASSQHYARSVALLKRDYRVYAVDVVGYGRSEKVPTAYTQDLWECMLYEFVRSVVRKPAYVAGNSIGGYFGASFAADAYPDYCAGLVLLNSAGKLEDADDAAAAESLPRSSSPFAALQAVGKYVLHEWRPARMFAANALLRNLRGRIGTTLKLVYPTNPDCADEALAKEIYRNSLDFGADEVLASGIVLPPPRSLTELLSKYSGPLLVYQGILDPLNSAGDRAEKIRKAYPDATVAKRQLGHCPHDEDAADFSKTVAAWMESENGKSAALQQVADDGAVNTSVRAEAM